MSGITYVLATAIENYHDSSAFKKVFYAERDATEFIQACIGLGYDKDDTVLLTNNRATKTSILNNLSRIVDKVVEEDRMIFYFAGHGFSVSTENFLAPVDASIDSLDNTCISITQVLELLRKSNSKRNILFLDSCHSGFERGEYIRDGTTSFRGDNLEYDFKDIEYCIGFASCKSNQKSYSDPSIQHGIWSHFLLNALKGQTEEDIYEEGYLMSDKLQAYLRRSTQEFVKKNIKKDQIPIEFGNKMDRFIVADLNSLFQAIETSKRVSTLNLTSISIYNLEEEGKIRHLDGFIKGYHSVPNKTGAFEDRFIKSISNDIINKEMAKLSGNIQQQLNYKRKEIDIHKEDGIGTIETPDFSYSIIVSQSEKFPDQYEVRRTLDYIKNPDIINNKIFNEIFDNYFTSLSFHFNKKLDVAKFIDVLEEQGKRVSYDPSNLKRCSIELDGLDTEIIITEMSLDIFFTYPSTPQKLVEYYKNATLHLQLNKINLLSNTV